MRKFDTIWFLLFLIPFWTAGQVPFVDTVCINEVSNYAVIGEDSSTYIWSVGGGQLITAGNNDSVSVLWDATPGVYEIELVQISSKGCMDTVRGKVLVDTMPNVGIIGKASICSGDSVILTAVHHPNVIWEDGRVSASIVTKPTYTHNYFVVGVGACGNDTAYHLVQVFPSPVADFSWMPKIPITFDVVEFIFEGKDASIFSWMLGDNELISERMYAEAIFTEPGYQSISLLVSNINGCKDSVTYQLYIGEQVSLWIANAFSPNQDGLNDRFLVYSNVDSLSYHIIISDRWGGKVFESDAISAGWDGNINGMPAPEGVYVYKIIYSQVRDGFPGRKYLKKGTIRLFR